MRQVFFGTLLAWALAATAMHGARADDCPAALDVGRQAHLNIRSAANIFDELDATLKGLEKTIRGAVQSCDAALNAGDQATHSKAAAEFAALWPDYQAVARRSVAAREAFVAALESGLAAVAAAGIACQSQEGMDAMIAKADQQYRTTRDKFVSPLPTLRAKLGKVEKPWSEQGTSCATAVAAPGTASSGEPAVIVVHNQTGTPLHVHPLGILAQGDFQVAPGEKREIPKSKFYDKTADGQKFFQSTLTAVGGGHWRPGEDQAVYEDAAVCRQRKIARDGTDVWVVTAGLDNPCSIRER